MFRRLFLLSLGLAVFPYFLYAEMPEITNYDRLDQVFRSSAFQTVPTREDFSHWWSGRCFTSHEPNKPLPVLLMSKFSKVEGDLGPLLEKREKFQLAVIGEKLFDPDLENPWSARSTSLPAKLNPDFYDQVDSPLDLTQAEWTGKLKKYWKLHLEREWQEASAPSEQWGSFNYKSWRATSSDLHAREIDYVISFLKKDMLYMQGHIGYEIGEFGYGYRKMRDHYRCYLFKELKISGSPS